MEEVLGLSQLAAEWAKRLRTCESGREGCEVICQFEKLLDGLDYAQKHVLFPLLHRLLGFNEWIEESEQHETHIRELIRDAQEAKDPGIVRAIANELANRLERYLYRMQCILFPRLVQALPQAELADLGNRLGPYRPE